MGEQPDGNFLPGSLPHKFTLFVKVIICFVANKFYSLSLCTEGVRLAGGPASVAVTDVTLPLMLQQQQQQQQQPDTAPRPSCTPLLTSLLIRCKQLVNDLGQLFNRSLAAALA